MIIRTALFKDSEELIKVIMRADNRAEELARERVNSYIKSNKKMFLIAIIDEKIVGYVSLKKEENSDKNASKFIDLKKYSCIGWIAVLPEYRKHKIGSKMIKACWNYMRKFNKEGIWLDCRLKLIPFYEKNGYKNVGDYIDEKRKQNYIMLKEIKNEK